MATLEELTRSYESFFGDPQNIKNIFSYKNAQNYDNSSTFPQAIIDQLNVWGLTDFYIPQQYGGRLNGFDELYHVIRLTSRRDLTTAIGHAKTMLGAISVWIAGSERQRQRLADMIREYNAVSLALTEFSHGSDISASTSFCTKTDNGYCLNGEKYLINNARRSTALTVFARTAAKNNARDFSLFWVEKQALPESALSYLPKLLTHGIKGADISGIRFNNAPLSAESGIGAEGKGLEIILCGFQLTRTLCSALSCGAGDHALRVAWQHAEQRQLYQQTLSQLPIIHRRLTESAVDLLIADTVSLFSSRAINILPQQMSVISAVTKAYVPTQIEAMVDGLVDVMGARAYLEKGEGVCHFSKLQRDCRLVSLFDGNTLINLQSLIVQLPLLARQRQNRTDSPQQQQCLADLFTLDKPLEPMQPEQLRLSSKGQDFIVNSLPNLASQLNAIADLSDQVKQHLHQLIQQISQRLQTIDRFFLHYTPCKNIPPHAFEMAEKYTHVYAAACCLLAFIYSRSAMSPHWQDGQALCVCLKRMTNQPLNDNDNMFGLVQQTLAAHQLISFFPFTLASDH